MVAGPLIDKSDETLNPLRKSRIALVLMPLVVVNVVALKVIPLAAGWKFAKDSGERFTTWGAPASPCGVAGGVTDVGADSLATKLSKVVSTGKGPG